MQLDIFSQIVLVLAVIVLEQVIVWFAEDFWAFWGEVRKQPGPQRLGPTP